MSYTNSTPNYELPQWIGTDKPTFLGDFNNAFDKIDTQMKANADASTAATATANSAAATATSANTNATTALNTANNAASQAASATSAAASATSTANTASTDAAAALRASAANTIENLAPAYDPTLTYAVGDLVTFIDDQNSGKLYKCIVAVNTPMEFNINYWDDVTCSEIFAKSSKLISQATTDGVKTQKDILDELGYGQTFNMNKRYILFTKYSTSNFIRYSRTASPADLEFFDTTILKGAQNLQTTSYVIKTNNDSDAFRIVCQSSDNSVTFTDRSSTVLPAGENIFLYEMDA